MTKSPNCDACGAYPTPYWRLTKYTTLWGEQWFCPNCVKGIP